MNLEQLMGQLGLARAEDEPGDEWHRDQGDYLIALTSTGDGTWWLTVAAGSGEIALEFSGNLGAAILQYAAVVNAIQAGVFGSRR